MTNDNELRPTQPRNEMELLDDDRLDGVAGGADREYHVRWCPRRPGNPHRWQRTRTDDIYNYYWCPDCRAEMKSPANWTSDDNSMPPRILMRPGM